jgi:ligand-binding sensor domain-containing protein/signal transduction histidine kinase
MMSILFPMRDGPLIRYRDVWLVSCLVLSFFFGFATRSAVASTETAPILHFEHFGRAQGLPSGSISGVAQDHSGFIWVGTNNGIYRYDGYRLRAYRGGFGEKSGLSSSTINVLHVDFRGRLWVGTTDGLHRYLPEQDRFARLVPLSSRDEVNTLQVSDIASDDAGAIWFAIGRSLQRFDPDTNQFTIWRHDPSRATGLGPGSVRAVAIGTRGELWVLTGDIVNRLERGANAFERFSLREPADPRMKSNAALSLGAMRDGSLWIGTALDVEVWKPGPHGMHRERYGELQGIPPGGITGFAEDPEGNVWIGTVNGGVKRWDVRSRTLQGFTHSDTNVHSLASPTARRLLFDRNGLLWIGTLNGLDRTDPRNSGFQRFRDDPGLETNAGARAVNAIAGTPDGEIWLGSGLGTIVRWHTSRYGPNAVFKIGEKYKFDNNGVHALLLDNKRGLWAGTGRGLYYLASGAKEFSRLSLSDSNEGLNMIESLAFDRDGQLWVGTVGGLHRLDLKGGIKTFSRDPRLPGSISGRSNSILVDRKNRVWVGTPYGLDRWESGTDNFVHYRSLPADPASLRGAIVRHLIEDKAGNIWAATDKGVSWMTPDAPGKVRWRHIGRAEGLAAEFTHALTEDAVGNIWVSTSFGLSRIEPHSGAVKNYYPSDGLDEDGYLARAVYRSANGHLMFGGTNGLTIFNPVALHRNRQAPPVVVADVYASNRSVLGDSIPDVTLEGPRGHPTGITVSYKIPMLAFELSALDYAAPERNRYAYKLEGFDNDWIEADADRRLATYTNLDPGSYVLKVKAANKDGVWSESPVSLNVTVVPPFWRTWWFRALVVAAIACGLLLWHRSRILRLERQKRELEGEVALRTADAVHQRDQAEAARRRIAELSEAGRAITATLDLATISRRTCVYAGRFVNVAYAALGIVDERGKFNYQWIDSGNDAHERIGVALPSPGSIGARCLNELREIVIDDAGCKLAAGTVLHSAEIDAAWNLGGNAAMVCLPVAIGEQPFGVLWARSPDGAVFSRVDIDSLLLLADYAAVALQNFDAYRQLQDSQQQLVLREKMAALGTLTAGVAHEINNPANFAHAGAQVLEQNLRSLHQMLRGLAGDDDPDITRLLDDRFGELANGTSTILNGTTRIRSLVRDLRTFVRLDEAERKEVRISEGLRATVALMRAQYPDVHIAPEIADDPLLECWPALLNQVFFGVLDNACRAVTTRAAQAPAGWRGEVAVRSTFADAQLQVAFVDNGCGMSEDVRTRVVEPFFTTRAVDEGTGLGLSIAFGIVARHHGHIHIESKEGEGTTVTITLPLAGHRQEAVAEAAL